MSQTADKSVEVFIYLPVSVSISMQSSDAADLFRKLRKIDKEEVAAITVTVNGPVEIVINSSTMDQLIGGLEREIDVADKKVVLFSV